MLPFRRWCRCLNKKDKQRKNNNVSLSGLFMDRPQSLQVKTWYQFLRSHPRQAVQCWDVTDNIENWDWGFIGYAIELCLTAMLRLREHLMMKDETSLYRMYLGVKDKKPSEVKAQHLGLYHSRKESRYLQERKDGTQGGIGLKKCWSWSTQHGWPSTRIRSGSSQYGRPSTRIRVHRLSEDLRQVQILEKQGLCK